MSVITWSKYLAYIFGEREGCNNFCSSFMQTISWLVAGLVILINGYLLLEFFSSEVRGIPFTVTVSGFIGAYLAFIVYLISRDITFCPWRCLAQSKQAQISWINQIFNVSGKIFQPHSTMAYRLQICFRELPFICEKWLGLSAK